MGKGQARVIAALDDIRRSLPFPLVGIDSDSGSEFINFQLVRWCQSRNIAFTRSRPYKKNDNAHIEQKNFTHVRKIFGWLRFDSMEALEAMNALYTRELRVWMNHFQPSVKLIRKERVGSRIHKHYDSPKTPYQRVGAHGFEPATCIEDPFELGQRITEAIAEMGAMANSLSLPAKPRHGPSVPALSNHGALIARAAGKILGGATVGR